jgi:Ran GTPase-activating protein (RanGAP) involved in mRNA processing and transport
MGNKASVPQEIEDIEPSEWTNDDVCAFVASFADEEQVGMVQQAGLTGKHLPSISIHDLDRLGFMRDEGIRLKTLIVHVFQPSHHVHQSAAAVQQEAMEAIALNMMKCKDGTDIAEVCPNTGNLPDAVAALEHARVELQEARRLLHVAHHALEVTNDVHHMESASSRAAGDALELDGKVKKSKNAENKIDILVVYDELSSIETGEALVDELAPLRTGAVVDIHEVHLTKDKVEQMCVDAEYIVVILSKEMVSNKFYMLVLKSIMHYGKQKMLLQVASDSELFPQDFGHGLDAFFVQGRNSITPIHKDHMTFCAKAVDEALRIQKQHIKLTPHARRQSQDASLQSHATRHRSLNDLGMLFQAFVSFKRSSASGIVGRLRSELGETYTIFADCESHPNLPSPSKCVECSLVFIFVFSRGILDSPFAMEELCAAVRLRKRIIFVRDIEYEPVVPYATMHGFKHFVGLRYLAHKEHRPVSLELASEVEEVLRWGWQNSLSCGNDFFPSFLKRLQAELGAGVEACDVIACNAPRSLAMFVTQQLPHLSLGQLGRDEMVTLVKTLRFQGGLVSLDISNNDLGSDELNSIASFIQGGTGSQSLTSLSLADNPLGAVSQNGLIVLAAALKTNSLLTHLDLSGVQLTGEKGNKLTGLLAIANAMQASDTMVSAIDLCRNQLDGTAAMHLAHAMTSMRTLTALDLHGNNIDTQGVIAIAESVQESQTLTHLVISGNQIVKCTTVDYLEKADLRPFDPLAWDGGSGGQDLLPLDQAEGSPSGGRASPSMVHRVGSPARPGSAKKVRPATGGRARPGSAKVGAGAPGTPGKGKSGGGLGGAMKSMLNKVTGGGGDGEACELEEDEYPKGMAVLVRCDARPNTFISFGGVGLRGGGDGPASTGGRWVQGTVQYLNNDGTCDVKCWDYAGIDALANVVTSQSIVQESITVDRAAIALTSLPTVAKGSRLLLAEQELGHLDLIVWGQLLSSPLRADLLKPQLLREIDLSGNNVNAQALSVVAVAMFQTSLSSVTALDLGRNQICGRTNGNAPGEFDGLKLLLRAIEHRNCLTYLGLRCNVLGHQGTQLLAEALPRLHSLSALDLKSNEVCGRTNPVYAGHMEALAALCTCLQLPKCSLTALDLSSNVLGLKGIQLFSTCLEYMPTLARLDLGKNKISTQGAKVLAQRLAGLQSLTYLDIEENYFYDEGIRHVAAALKINRSLTFVNLASNRIKPDGKKAIDEVKIANWQLTVQLDPAPEAKPLPGRRSSPGERSAGEELGTDILAVTAMVGAFGKAASKTTNANANAGMGRKIKLAGMTTL